jgi:hypothetical protein
LQVLAHNAVLLDERLGVRGDDRGVGPAEARALGVLAHTFETLPLRDEEIPLANHVFIELRAASEDLGGQLTAAQHQKFEAADAARRRLVAQML